MIVHQPGLGTSIVRGHQRAGTRAHQHGKRGLFGLLIGAAFGLSDFFASSALATGIADAIGFGGLGAATSAATGGNPLVGGLEGAATGGILGAGGGSALGGALGLTGEEASIVGSGLVGAAACDAPAPFFGRGSGMSPGSVARF